MIGPLLRVAWISLKRDRVALFLTFVLPIVFFSIFALVFSGMGGDSVEEIELEVLVVDLDRSDVSRRLVAALSAHEALSVSMAPEVRAEAPSGEAGPPAWSRETAYQAVRQGEADAALVLPAGLEELFGGFEGETPRVELIYDASNPMARFMLSGLLQAASFQSAPDVLMDRGLGMLERFGGELTREQREAVDFIRPFMVEGRMTEGSDGMAALVAIDATAAHGEGDGDVPSIVAYYAAGTGVMFLLFSMSGAAGGLLEEEERGTLERLLSTDVGMSLLLGSRWIFFTAMGALQVLLMFVWGWAVFGLDLWGLPRVTGVVAMSLVTAAAASSFGLVLAAACRSRAQLGGVATIAILVMSALGGSMMPRFIMPDFMNSVAKLTINGWALDGFLKVFWYADPAAGAVETLRRLLPELLVLSALAAIFFGLARRLARRWEVV
jgi:ABC-2 type transport system permease protein